MNKDIQIIAQKPEIMDMFQILDHRVDPMNSASDTSPKDEIVEPKPWYEDEMQDGFIQRSREALRRNGTTKFACGLVDPPWNIHQRGKKGAARHYELMTLDRIKQMPVSELLADDAHLWLWVPNGLLQEGLDVMKEWGFTFRTTFYYIKPGLGLGNYIRTASETVLFGTRGKAPVKFHGQPNWLFAPRLEHSHKPEEQYAVIERVSPGPYLELFARRRQPGWAIWGNEVDSDIYIPGYPVPHYSDEAILPEGVARHIDIVEEASNEEDDASSEEEVE